MADLESLASVKRKLEGIRSEHSARMELATRKIQESDKATAEGHKEFVDKQKRLVERLREMTKAQQDATAGRAKPDELAFGLGDEDAAPDDLAEEVAALQRARAERASKSDDGSYLQSGPSSAPSRWNRAQPEPELPEQPPPVRPVPPARRQPARPTPDDDDDFGGQSWLT